MGIHVEKVLLFGSQARGKADEDSDIDLLIVSPDFAPLNDLDRRRLLGRARLKLWQPIHAYPATPQELENVEPATFLEDILEKGMRVA